MRKYFFFLWILCSCQWGMAQNHGVIKGRIYDTGTQKAVPFASVVIYGTTIGVAADGEGNYRIEEVPPGYVRIEISSVGYKTQITSEFLVSTAVEHTENAGLEAISTALEEVTVKADLSARQLTARFLYSGSVLRK